MRIYLRFPSDLCIDRMVNLCYHPEIDQLVNFERRDGVEISEKGAVSKQRILISAMSEFAKSGYEGASVNSICSQNNISKGLIYHYFSDKEELYLSCVETCFNHLTEFLSRAAKALSGSISDKLTAWFDARMDFFANNPLYLGIFSGALLSPPAGLACKIASLRTPFDQLNISVLRNLLTSGGLRPCFDLDSVILGFRMYMDFFNLRFKDAVISGVPPQQLLSEHEKLCRMQVYVMLHGLLEDGREESGI